MSWALCLCTACTNTCQDNSSFPRLKPASMPVLWLFWITFLRHCDQQDKTAYTWWFSLLFHCLRLDCLQWQLIQGWLCLTWRSLTTVVNSLEQCSECLSAEPGSQGVMEQLEMHSLLGSFCSEVPAALKQFWLLPKAVVVVTAEYGLWASDRGEIFGFWMTSGRFN